METENRVKNTEEGLFWVPSREDLKITGDIIVSEDEGIILSIKDCFYAEDSKNEILQVVFGQTVKGKKISLFECYRLNRNVINSRTTSSNYDVGMAIEGHIRDYKEFNKYKFIHIEFDKAVDWAGDGVIQVQKNSNRDSKWELSYQVDDLISCELTKMGTKVEIINLFDICDGLNGYYGINHRVAWRYYLKEGKISNLDDILALVDSFQSLFSILIGGPTRLTKVILSENHSGGDTVYIPQRMLTPSFKTNTVKMPCPLNKIRLNISEIIDNWLSVFGDYSGSYTGLRVLWYWRNVPLEATFLFLSQSLEAFYSSVVSQLHDEKHAPLGRKKSFREQILCLFDYLNYSPIVEHIGHRDDVAFGIKEIRNFYSHGRDKNAADTENFRFLSDVNIVNEYAVRIEILLHCCLLKKIGCPLDVSFNRLRKKHYWIKNVTLRLIDHTKKEP